MSWGWVYTSSCKNRKEDKIGKAISVPDKSKNL